MKTFWNPKTIPYAIVSILLFAALFFLTYPDKTAGTERQTVQLVTFGDSVFGMVRDETAIPNQLAARMDMTFYNAALGGTRAARGDLEHRLDYAKDSLSLVGLIKSVGAEDFGVQQDARIRESMTEYFEEVIDGLEAIDFAGVELVVIQHGLNDYYSGVPISNEDNLYDEYTFAGALRTSLSILKAKYPDLRIVLVTPTYTWYMKEELTCEEFDAGYGILEDYVEAEAQVAGEFGVELLDLYHDFFPHETWSDWELYTTDGLHPNEAGRALIADRIAAYLGKSSADES